MSKGPPEDAGGRKVDYSMMVVGPVFSSWVPLGPFWPSEGPLWLSLAPSPRSLGPLWSPCRRLGTTTSPPRSPPGYKKYKFMY